MNPYDELDVPHDADTAALKRAYRKKASKHHPDKEGGNKEKFQAVKLAYELLDDPARRKHFDETGETQQQPSIEEQATKGLASIVLAAIESEPTVETMNLDKLVRDTINGGIAGRRSTVSTHKRKIKKMETAKARLLKKNGGENALSKIIDFEIAGLERKIKVIELDVVLGNAMLLLWDDYEYRADVQRNNVPPMMSRFYFNDSSI